MNITIESNISYWKYLYDEFEIFKAVPLYFYISGDGENTGILEKMEDKFTFTLQSNWGGTKEKLESLEALLKELPNGKYIIDYSQKKIIYDFQLSRPIKTLDFSAIPSQFYNKNIKINISLAVGKEGKIYRVSNATGVSSLAYALLEITRGEYCHPEKMTVFGLKTAIKLIIDRYGLPECNLDHRNMKTVLENLTRIPTTKPLEEKNTRLFNKKLMISVKQSAKAASGESIAPEMLDAEESIYENYNDVIYLSEIVGTGIPEDCEEMTPVIMDIAKDIQGIIDIKTKDGILYVWYNGESNTKQNLATVLDLDMDDEHIIWELSSDTLSKREIENARKEMKNSIIVQDVNKFYQDLEEKNDTGWEH